MRKIVSKVDCELQKFGEKDLYLLSKFWDVVKNKEFIINESIQVIDDKKSGKKTFFAPAICHMILCNPHDVDAEVYDKLVKKIIYTPDLNRITVFDNMSFLYLVLRNNELELDNYALERVGTELNDRTSEKVINKVYYKDIKRVGEEVAFYDDEDFTISVCEKDAKVYEKGDQFSIREENNHGEMELLRQIVMLENSFDVDVENMIRNLYTNSYSKEMTRSIPMVRNRVLTGQK